jgi:hypothetical protein
MLLLSLLACGCAGPFGQFYYDLTGGVDITELASVAIPSEEPKLLRGSDQEKDAYRMLEDGYGIVGYSSFNAGNVNEKGAIIQAKKVHAAVVLVYGQYTNTVSGAMPLTLPDTQTSTTSLYGSAYGYGGSTTYSGTAYTTTYGTRTTYIPYSVRRYDYLATYWVKLKEPILGIHGCALTDEVRQEIGSNQGALVHAVITGSPAFRADILRGDVVKKLGKVDVSDVESFQKALGQHAGEQVTVEIMRGGQTLRKEIKLNESPLQ